ncbi:MAG: O-antigen ligase family protein [Acidobacteriota bacterium]|nr:O-antigen ligase family protein [Acidobacteriota bacterium]
MTRVVDYLNNGAYCLVLCCLVVVSFSFALTTYHPFEAIKELLFHLLVVFSSSFIVVWAILTRAFPIKRNPLFIFVFLYLCCNTLSFALSPYADKSYFINLVLLSLFFTTVVVSVNSEKKIEYLLYSIAVVAGGSSIYGLMQFFGYDYLPLTASLGVRGLGARVYSFFGNPNEFAAVLVMCLPLLLAGFFHVKGKSRYLFSICFLLAIVGLLLAGARAALLGSGVAIVLFFAISYGKVHKRRYLCAVSLTFVLIAAGFVYTIVKPPSSSFELRKYWWQNTLQIVQDYPLLGTGVGSFNVYYPQYRSRSTDIALGFDSGVQARLEHPHNEFIEILSDLGILGFVLFVGIIGAFFYNYYVKWSPHNKYLVAGNCCALTGILVHNLYSQNLRFVFVAMFFWLNLALQSVLLSGPKTKSKVILNRGRVIVSFFLLSISAVFFLNQSFRVYLADSYLQRGLGAYGVNDFDVAGAHLKNAVENNPQNKAGLYYLGMSQFMLEKYPESKETLRKLVWLDPNYLRSHYWLANNYFMTQDFEMAKAEYKEAIKVDDAFGEAYYDLGRIAMGENDSQQALSYFQKAHQFASASVSQNAKEYMGIIRREPDLVVSGVISPTITTIGDELTVDFTVKNIGWGPSGPSQIRFFFPGNPDAWSYARQDLFPKMSVDSLEPGSMFSGQATVIVPHFLASGGGGVWATLHGTFLR